MRLNTFLIMFHDGTWVYNQNSSLDFEKWIYTDDKGKTYELINKQDIYKDIKDEDKIYNFCYLEFMDINYKYKGDFKDREKIITKIEMLIKYKEEWKN